MAFGYPKFDKDGVKVLTDMNGINSDMMMDIKVVRLAAGKSASYLQKDKEICVMLTEGEVEFSGGGVSGRAARSDVYRDLPVTLHVCKGTEVTVTEHYDGPTDGMVQAVAITSRDLTELAAAGRIDPVVGWLVSINGSENRQWCLSSVRLPIGSECGLSELPRYFAAAISGGGAASLRNIYF